MADFKPLDTIKRLGTKPGDEAPRMLGRFELQRLLGQGAQSTVWLGFDPRLERQVAIKLLRCAPGVDNAALQQWLQEARSVARLTHPHIVPVFEADVHEHQPYLVFEYVAGQTLAQKLKQDGAMAAQEAVALMLGVLGALQAAHAAGVVHLDLKPSNILLDAQGRARVTDFGIAARIAVAEPGATVPGRGTPGYMAPEAAAGAPPKPAMDIFSAGLVLAELLTGRALVHEVDPMRAIYRIAHEDLALPAGAAQGTHGVIDDHLRSVVQQAIRRVPSQRFATVAAMQQALLACLQRADGAEQESPLGGNSKSTLEFLLRRMRHKSDFPALSDSVARIQRLANSDNESVGSLTNEILKDIALTNKLLRLVNTAHFSHAGGGSISTVSRAVALVGFNGIRNMALSLVLLDHMQDKAHANLLKEEFLRCLMAGSVASELCSSERDREDAFIGAMFQNLGRLLTDFYFPEEARQVRGYLAGGQDEQAASTRVLGLNFEDLGVGVARAWGLPENLQRCMRKPLAKAGMPLLPQPQDRVRWLAMAANEVADSLLQHEPEQAAQQIRAVSERYARPLGLQAKEIQQATAVAREKLAQMAQAMQLQVLPSSPAQRLLLDPAAATVAAPPEDEQALHATALQAADPPAPADSAQAQHTTDVMVAGIQDITNAMVESFKLNEVIRMILETMLRALKCRRIVFCLRDVKSDCLTGRFGLGAGVEAVIPAFRIALKGQADLFSLVCGKGADTLISDASDPLIAARLPSWYQTQVHAPSFVLLPLQIKGGTFALIYADTHAVGGIKLDEKQLSLLRTLRNQAVMAFRQAG
jgi:serine/threonine protein kinase